VKKLLMGAAIAALSLGTLAASAGMASAAPNGLGPLDEGNYNVTFCQTGGVCNALTWNLGANHVMTSSSFGPGTWKFVGLTHTLTVHYSLGCMMTFTGTGTAEHGFSGTFSSPSNLCPGFDGTFTAAEPAGV
jgi:hypothetical protein